MTHAHSTPDHTYAQLCTGCATQTISHYAKKHDASRSGTPYRDALEAKEMRALDAFGARDMFRPLILRGMHDRLANHDRDTINVRMARKLLHGGYGQLPDAWLDLLDFSQVGDAAKERVRVGWANTGTSSPSQQHEPAAFGFIPILNDTGNHASVRFPNDGKPLSVSSAQMVGQRGGIGDTAFFSQGPVSPFTGGPWAEYTSHDEEDYDDDQDVDEQFDGFPFAQLLVPLNGEDCAGLHPDRLRMLEEGTHVPPADHVTAAADEGDWVNVPGHDNKCSGDVCPQPDAIAAPTAVSHKTSGLLRVYFLD